MLWCGAVLCCARVRCLRSFWLSNPWVLSLEFLSLSCHLHALEVDSGKLFRVQLYSMELLPLEALGREEGNKCMH